MERIFEAEKNQSKEHVAEENEIIKDLESIEMELEERLKYLLLVKKKGEYKWTGEGLEDKDLPRPKGVERGQILKDTRDTLISKYPAYDEFIAALTDAFQPGAEWSQLATHLLLVNKDKPLVMRKFWNILKKLHAFGDSFQSAKEGVLSQVAAGQIFEALGYRVRTATPKEDISNEDRPGVDLFIGTIPVQVKSKKIDKGVFINIKKENGGITLFFGGEGINRFTGLPDQQIVEKASKALTDLGIQSPLGR